MQPGGLMPGHSTQMQRPESTQVSSLYFRTIYTNPVIKLCRVVSVLRPPLPPLFRQGPRGAHGGWLGRRFPPPSVTRAGWPGQGGFG